MKYKSPLETKPFKGYKKNEASWKQGTTSQLPEAKKPKKGDPFMPDHDISHINHALGADTSSAGSSSGGGESGGGASESLNKKGKNQMTNQKLREQLNKMDLQALDEGTPYYDLLNLYESLKPMSKEDTDAVIAAAKTKNQETLNNVMLGIQAKTNPALKNKMKATTLESVENNEEEIINEEDLDEGRNDLVPKKCISLETHHIYYSPYDTKEKDFAKFGIRFRYDDRESCIDAINDQSNDLGYGEDGVNHDKEDNVIEFPKAEDEKEKIAASMDTSTEGELLTESVWLHIDGENDVDDEEYATYERAMDIGAKSGKDFEVYDMRMNGDKVHLGGKKLSDKSEPKKKDDNLTVMNDDDVQFSSPGLTDELATEAALILQLSGTPLFLPKKYDDNGNPVLDKRGVHLPKTSWGKIKDVRKDLGSIAPGWLMLITLYELTKNEDGTVNTERGIEEELIEKISGVDDNDGHSALESIRQVGAGRVGWLTPNGFTEAKAGINSKKGPDGTPPKIYPTSNLQDLITKTRPIYRKFKDGDFEEPIGDLKINVLEDIIKNDKYNDVLKGIKAMGDEIRQQAANSNPDSNASDVINKSSNSGVDTREKRGMGGAPNKNSGAYARELKKSGATDDSNQSTNSDNNTSNIISDDEYNRIMDDDDEGTEVDFSDFDFDGLESLQEEITYSESDDYVPIQSDLDTQRIQEEKSIYKKALRIPEDRDITDNDYDDYKFRWICMQHNWVPEIAKKDIWG